MSAFPWPKPFGSPLRYCLQDKSTQDALKKGVFLYHRSRPEEIELYSGLIVCSGNSADSLTWISVPVVKNSPTPTQWICRSLAANQMETTLFCLWPVWKGQLPSWCSKHPWNMEPSEKFLRHVQSLPIPWVFWLWESKDITHCGQAKVCATCDSLQIKTGHSYGSGLLRNRGLKTTYAHSDLQTLSKCFALLLTFPVQTLNYFF